MSEKSAILFINKIFTDKVFKQSFVSKKCQGIDAVIHFAEEQDFHFSAEEFKSAYLKNYKMRWILHIGSISL
jgi:hypothetical protein